MIGIEDMELFDNIIRKCEVVADDISLDFNSLKTIMSYLGDNLSYISDIKYLSETANNNKNNINNIKTMLYSYITLLKSVKTSYIVQDEIFAREINNMIQ